MPRFLALLLLATIAQAAAPLPQPSRTCELVSETILVHRRGPRMDLYIQAAVATDSTQGALLYAFPAGAERGGSTFHPATLANFSHQLVPRRKYVLGTLRQTLADRQLGPYPAAMPEQPIRRLGQAEDVALLTSDRLDKRGGVAGWATDQGLATDAAFERWARTQSQAGREIWAVAFSTRAKPGELQALELPPLRVTYASAEAMIPFSQPQGGPVARANTTDRPFRLAIFADQRLAPNYPDGYPVLPDMALQYAYRIGDESWAEASKLAPLGPPERGAADYLSDWEANVPSTARADEIVLVPQPGPEVPPREVVEPEVTVPIPIDLIVVVALFLIATAIFARRRRSRGRTNSAGEPATPDAGT